MLTHFILVGTGGALGAIARYGLVLAFASRAPSWAVIVGVNVLGSFLIGAMAQHVGQGAARLFWTVGVLGGFTTFSAYAWDGVQLLQTGKPGVALIQMVLTPVLCLIAAYVGFRLTA